MRAAICVFDESLAAELQQILETAAEPFRVHILSAQSLAGSVSHKESFDIMVIDARVSLADTAELMQRVRIGLDRRAPVLTVFDVRQLVDIKRLVDLGADDFVLAPVDGAQFLARVQMLVQRSASSGFKARLSPTQATLHFAPYRFDLDARALYLRGDHVPTTDKEFDLALILFRGFGKSLSRGHIMEMVWARSAELTTRTIDTHISRLRNKLELNGRNGYRLVSVYNVGYRLDRFDVEGSRVVGELVQHG